MNQTCSPKVREMFSPLFRPSCLLVTPSEIAPSAPPSSLSYILLLKFKHLLHKEALLDLLVSAYSVPMLWLCTAMIFLWRSSLPHCTHCWWVWQKIARYFPYIFPLPWYKGWIHFLASSAMKLNLYYYVLSVEGIGHWWMPPSSIAPQKTSVAPTFSFPLL